MEDILIRRAREEDVPTVKSLFHQAYGPDYPYSEFYDDYWLKKTVYSDNYLFLVAEQKDEILGTAAIYFEVGSYTDLLGEFGRLVVAPHAQGMGIGEKLLVERLRFADKRLHFGFVEARTSHTFAQRIATKYGFQPIGLLPLKILISQRESLAVLGQLFGPARELRRNNPRVIPEIFPLASKALGNLEFPNDLIVVDDVVSYPMRGKFEVAELTETGFPHLLRIERGRLKRRQIFGNLMLSYGFFHLQTKEAQYLVARQGDIIVGAIGYVHDQIGKNISIIELIDVDDTVSGFLLRELDRRAREDLNVSYIEVAVSAYWPRMQRTLEQLGFCPVAYCPAYVFRGVERLDAIRMAKLYVPLDMEDVHLIPGMEDIANIIFRGFIEKRVGIQIDAFTRNVAVFQGLHDAQLSKITGICKIAPYAKGAVVFRQDQSTESVYMVLSGEIDILMEPGRVCVGKVLSGDVLGEIALIEGLPHSATAVAARDSELIMISRQDFEALIQQNPHIGMTVMRNIAHSLGNKLKATDIAVSQLYLAQSSQNNPPMASTAKDKTP